LNKLDDKKFTQSLTITLLLVTLIVPMSLHSSGTSGFEEALAIEYDKTQVTSEINECGNGQFPLSVLCQNSDSEVQGNGNAINIIGHQTSINGQSIGSVLKVTKIVLCPEDVVCPTPSDFTLSVSGNNPSPSLFPGSSQGTFVRLNSGMYSVSEKSPSNPPGLTLQTSFSPGCNGAISSGESLSCTIVNQYTIFECGPIQNLSDNEGSSLFPQIAASGNNVYVVWADNTNPTGSIDLFFRKSIDGGSTFGPTQNLLENAPGESVGQPQVVASGNNVFVVWDNGNPEDGNKILLRKSIDAGMTFSPIVELSDTIPESFTAPQVIASGNNVYVAWESNTNVFFTRSLDAGASFEPVSIGDEAGGNFAKIATSGNNVAVVWQSAPGGQPGDIDTLFAVSTDGGASFGPVKNLNESIGGRNTNPHVALTGNSVYVVWEHDTGKTDIVFARSTDAGTSFDPVKILSQDTPDSFEPQLASIGSNVYVIWGGEDTFFSRSTNEGASFEPVQNLSNNGGDFTHGGLRIGVSSNDVYVVWVDNSLGNESVFLARSTDAGTSFDPVKNISEEIEESLSPNIAVSGNDLFVVWQSSNDIFYSRCTER
jgi:hypothetical protein